MAVNNPHSVDRSYKFIYKILGIIFHGYLYHEGEKIEFIETEIPDTGQRKDMMVRVDGKKIQITEFMATPLNEDKLNVLFDYHESTRRDQEYCDYFVKTSVFSIVESTIGKNTVAVDDNVTFHVDVASSKSKNAWKVLSTLTYKSFTQEELSFEEAVDLLVLPDMYFGKGEDMELPIRALMTMIIVLMGNVKFSFSDLKEKIFLCEKMVLARFFNESEFIGMIDMLKTVSKDLEIARKIEEYGPGFDEIYLNGRADGRADGIADGRADAKLEMVRNLLAKGVNMEIISDSSGFSIEELEKLKKEL